MSKKFSIDVDGVKMVKKQLDGVQQIENEKLATLGDELYAFGRAVAENGFAHADYAGTNDVEVGGFVRHRTRMEVNFTIWARGSSVLFIEFGTGVLHYEHPMADDYEMHHGTYGQGKGNNSSWVYKGEAGTSGIPVRDGVFRTTGNDPAAAMYKAWRSIQEGVEYRIRRWS